MSGLEVIRSPVSAIEGGLDTISVHSNPGIASIFGLKLKFSRVEWPIRSVVSQIGTGPRVLSSISSDCPALRMAVVMFVPDSLRSLDVFFLSTASIRKVAEAIMTSSETTSWEVVLRDILIPRQIWIHF